MESSKQVQICLEFKKNLESRVYHQYLVDPYVFYRKYSGILTYVYDCVIVLHKQDTTTSLIKSINNGPENYVLTYEGNISITGV